MTGLALGMGAGLDPTAPAIPLLSTFADLRERTPSAHADPCDQLAETMRTAWNLPVVDGDRVLSSPRGGLGYVQAVTGDTVESWARGALPGFRQLTDSAAYQRTAELYCAWARQAEAERLAALPADQRRADELQAERVRVERRAALERQRAEADRALAELDARTP